MAEMKCSKCHKLVSAAESAAFCPFCGEKLHLGGPDLSTVRSEPDPVKKHERLLALQETYPNNLEIAQELLHLGRLYERSKKGADFSIIKCYILNVYLEPEIFKKDKREAMRSEIFSHPDLDLCLRLCEDQEIFLRRYLERLSQDFIRLFLKGSSRHMHSFFGYVNESKAAKHLAIPAAGMLQAMQRDETLTAEQRKLLMQAFYDAFACQLDGDTQHLDAALQKYSIMLETK